MDWLHIGLHLLLAEHTVLHPSVQFDPLDVLPLVCILLDALLQLLLVVLARFALHFSLDDLRNLLVLQVSEPIDVLIDVAVRMVDADAAVDRLVDARPN